LKTPDTDKRKNLRETILFFLKLGIIGFGGPAVHFSIMRDELVRRRRWVTDKEFLDLVGATNLIPGPNSTEMAIHLGFIRAGWAGLIAGGFFFILPAFFIVLTIAWLYVEYGTVPEISWLLYGIKPVMIAIILQALLGLGKAALRGIELAVLGAVVLALFFLGVNELLLLAVGGITYLLFKIPGSFSKLSSVIPMVFSTQNGQHADLSQLFLIFLKIGSILYGSGYVLIAFLREDFVDRLHWLSNQQLIDAVAVGQITPGPVFTTATFVGYVLGGWNGAILATIGIFLPSFIFVAVSRPFIPRLRSSPLFSALLDGVIVASLALMAGVTYRLGRDAIHDWFTIALLLFSILILFRTKINSTWLIIAGALAGLIYKLIV